ncbi:ABC transporter permease [Rubrobacter naiadicus]|uniref:ABC transporter permease n=1 Tax=Rubrobacter naiadicus TaxID=1392641 RepID=UPI002361A612|nr:ABC transporter permease [Rubrobacter naiadicus]
MLRPRDIRRHSRGSHFIVQNTPLLLAVILLIATLLFYVGLFFTSLGRFPGNFEITSTINGAMPLILSATGQTVVFLSRGIDLSVGGMVDLTNSLAATRMGDNPISMALWSFVILLVGAAGGLINGLLVTLGRLQPILVTLATLSIFQGIAIKVLPQPGGKVPVAYTAFLTNPEHPWALVFVMLFIFLWFIFRRTPFGVAVYAIGNDEEAARANGIHVTRTRVGAYVVGGILAAAAGLFLAATTTSGDATAGDSYTLTSIAAAFLGGTTIFGGRGSALGSIAGALVLSIIISVLFFAGINQLYEAFYQGMFLVVAVALSMLLGRFFGRKRR